MYGHCTKKIEVVRSRGRITGKHLRFWGRQTARVPTVSRDAANTLYGLVGICHCEKSLLHTSGPTITTTSRHLFEFERFFFLYLYYPIIYVSSRRTLIQFCRHCHCILLYSRNMRCIRTSTFVILL